MAFFDMLKNKAAQAAQVAGAKAVNNLGQSAKQAISGATNKTYTVTLSCIPANLADMKRFILFLLAFVLVLGLAGCKEKPALGGETNEPEVQTEAKELTELKDRIKADGKLIGVAYLGWIEGDAEAAKTELAKLDYIEDISLSRI